MTSSENPAAELIILVIDVTEVACVYYGGSHLSEYCLANHVSISYVYNQNTSTPTIIHTISDGIIIQTSYGATTEINRSPKHQKFHLAFLDKIM